MLWSYKGGRKEMIIRGTTPGMTFGLPFDADMLETGYVTIQQGGSTVVEKALSDCECVGMSVSTKLTQEDTLKLSADCNAEIKIVVKTVDGDRFETEHPYVERVVDTAKDGVI